MYGIYKDLGVCLFRRGGKHVWYLQIIYNVTPSLHHFLVKKTDSNLKKDVGYRWVTYDYGDINAMPSLFLSFLLFCHPYIPLHFMK